MQRGASHSNVSAILISPKVIACNITSTGLEDSVTVSLQGAYNTSIIALSNSSVPITFASLKFVPAIAEFNSTSTHVLNTNASSSSVIPSKYRSLLATCTFSTSLASISRNCSINATGQLAFAKTMPISIGASIQTYSMTITFESISSSLKVASPFLQFSQDSVLHILPRAVLLLTNQTFQIQLNKTVFDSADTPNIYFFCKTSSTGSVEFAATKLNNSAVSCSIPYNTLTANDAIISVHARFNSIDTNTTYSISLSHTNTVYWFSRGSVAFSNSSQVQFFYTGVSSRVNITASIQFPSMEIKNNLLCKLSQFAAVQYFTPEITLGSSLSNQSYSCLVSTINPGRYNLSMVYRDPTPIEFDATTNSVELVFVEKTTVNSFAPSVSSANTSTPLVVSTGFKDADYGNDAIFYCKLSGATDMGANASVLATRTGSQFSCTVYSSAVQAVNFTISALMKGQERVILSESVNFYFVDSFFLDPNYGETSGGSLSIIKQFADATHNVSFEADPQTKFACVANGQLIQFQCTAVNVAGNTKLPPFYSYILYAGTRPLSSRYILYERKDIISLFPRVIAASSLSTVLNITLTGMANFTENAGSNGGQAILAIDENSVNAKRYSVASSMTRVIQVTLDQLLEGPRTLQLYFKQSHLLTIRNSLVISNASQVIVVTKNTLSFTSPVSNIGRANTAFNVSVSLPTDLELTVYPYVLCSLNNNFIKTYYSSSNRKDFTCEVTVAAGIYSLSLSYYAADVPSPVNVTSNSLEVIAASPIYLNSVLPFVSFSSSQVLSISSNDTIDSYGAFVTYSCITSTNATTLATRTGMVYSCTISRVNTHSAEQVRIVMNSKITGVQFALSTNSQIFYFSDTFTVSQITPFAQNVSALPVTTSVSFQLNKNTLVVNGLLCKYVSEEGDFSSTATIVGSTVNCSVFKSQMQNTTSILRVTLQQNNGVTTADISNSLELLFFNANIAFNTSTIYDTMVGGTMASTLIVPNSFVFSFKHFMKNPELNDVELVCTYKSFEKVLCSIPRTEASITPITLTYTVTITTGVRSLNWTVQSNTYVQTMEIRQVVPYIISVSQNSRITLSLSQAWNNAFAMQCRFGNQRGNSSLVNAIILSNAVHCSFAGFGVAENTTIALVYNSIQVSSNIALLNFVNTLNVSKSYDFSIGGAAFTVTLTGYPTVSVADYAYQLAFVDRTKLIYASCNYSHPILSCFVPQFASLPVPLVKTGMRLFINNSLAVVLPTFNVLKVPVISSVQPSNKIDVNANPYTVTFVGEYPLQAGVSETYVTYSETNGTYVSQVTCSFLPNAATRMRCPAPLGAPVDINLSLLVTIPPYNMSVMIANVLSTYRGVVPSVIEVVAPQEIAVGASGIVSIYGSNLNQSGSLIVKFYDVYVSVDVVPFLVNESTIVVGAPIFYDEGQFYPRNIKMLLQFSTSSISLIPSIQYTSISRMKIYPQLFPVGESLASLFLYNVPAIQLKQYHQRILFELYDANNVIPLVCNASVATIACNLTIPLPLVPCQLDVRIIAINATSRSNATLQTSLEVPLTVHAKPIVQGYAPNRIVQQLTSIVRIIGSGFPAAASVLLRIIPQTRSVVQQIRGTYESSSSIVFPVQNFATSSKMEISFNDGVSWLPYSSNVTIQSSFSLLRVENDEDDRFPSLYTFKQVALRVKGSGFTNQLSSYRVAFFSKVFEKTPVFTAADLNMVVASPTDIVFLSPVFSRIMENPSILKFPFDVKFGLSMNDGYDYKIVDFVFLDTFRQPLITFADYKFGEKGLGFEVLIRGQYFINLTTCVVAVGSYNQTSPITIMDSSTVSCAVPSIMSSYGSLLKVNVQNSKGETSSRSADIVYYDPPRAFKMAPTSGSTTGNFDLMLFLNKTDIVSDLYVKAGKVDQPSTCKLIRTTTNFHQIQCFIGAVEAGLADIELSYNRKQWYAASTQFLFTTCKAGFGTKSFKDACRPCAPGTYKPTAGLYDCLACKNGTYSDVIGAVSCDSCPNRATTLSDGASSLFNCTCTSSYFVNPLFDISKKPFDYCFPCPIGGVCNKTNTTIPEAAFGYWYTEKNNSLMFKCNPLASCPGGVFRTCAEGYVGDRCGRCLDGYYKFKKACTPCSRDAWWRLVVACVIVMILCAFFLTFSSLKVSHINGIAIAFSFWQVISMFAKFPNIQWPQDMNNSITAASFVNFNLDFLALECIFPVRFEVRYSLSLFFPLLLLLLAILFYVLSEIRSCIAFRIGKRLKIAYLPFIEDPEDVEAAPKGKVAKLKFKFGLFVVNTIRKMKNGRIWLRNHSAWYIQEGVTRTQMQILRDKIINAYLTFLSFAYSFLMTAASELFTCTTQLDGKYTLDSSPDILCWSDANWFGMLPIGVLLYGVMNGGLILLYLYLFAVREHMKKRDTPLRLRFKFILQRYRARFWFWDAVVYVLNCF